MSRLRQLILAKYFFLAMTSLLLGVSCCAEAAVNLATNQKLEALRQLATAYEHGEGVPKDVDKAVALYCEGATLGDKEAQFNLAWIYSNGRGVPRDDSLAAYLFGMASKQGHVQADHMLV